MTADFERLDELLAEAGAPVAATPHVDASADLEAACAKLGLSVPDGLRDWYRWRNGPGPLTPDSPARFVGRFAAVDVATAVRVRHIELDATAAIPADLRYQPGWFPILAGAGISGVIAVDCDTQPGTIVLCDQASELPERLDDRIAVDVDELVRRFIALFESGRVSGPADRWPHWLEIERGEGNDWWVYDALG